MESNGSTDLHTEHYDGFMALPFPVNPINETWNAKEKKKSPFSWLPWNSVSWKRRMRGGKAQKTQQKHSRNAGLEILMLQND